jgi:outer membrane lipoprotein-sorting protein
MKFAIALVLVALVLAITISGCVQQPSGPPAGGLTQEQAESQAFQALEQEMQENLEDMTLQEIENELFQQG